MNKSYTIKEIYSGMRIDRWIRNNVASLPQSLIEKSLRAGKIKINKKKAKSSLKLKANDKIEIFNLKFKVNIIQKKKLFNPSNEIIKSNEKLIIDNNDNFIVINKPSGIPVQAGTKSFKNIVDILK